MHQQEEIAFRFRTRERWVKTVNFDVGKNRPKLIGYHSNVPWTIAKLVSFIIRIYTSINAETLVMTGSVVVGIFRDIGQFRPSRSTIFIFYPTLTQKLLNRFSLFFTRCRAISVAIGAPIPEAIMHPVLKCQDAEWRSFRKFCPKLVAMGTSLEISKKRSRSTIYPQNAFIQ